MSVPFSNRQSERQDPKTITRAVRAGIATDTEHGSVVPPLYLSANYTFKAPGIPGQYDYSRTANPTRDQLADADSTKSQRAKTHRT